MLKSKIKREIFAYDLTNYVGDDPKNKAIIDRYYQVKQDADKDSRYFRTMAIYDNYMSDFKKAIEKQGYTVEWNTDHLGLCFVRIYKLERR